MATKTTSKVAIPNDIPSSDPHSRELSLAKTALIRLLNGIMTTDPESGTRALFRVPAFAASIASIILKRCGIPSSRIRVVGGYITHPEFSNTAIAHVWLDVKDAGRVDIAHDHSSMSHIVLDTEIGVSGADSVMFTYWPRGKVDGVEVLDRLKASEFSIEEGGVKPRDLEKDASKPKSYMNRQAKAVRKAADNILRTIAPWSKPPIDNKKVMKTMEKGVHVMTQDSDEEKKKEKDVVESKEDNVDGVDSVDSMKREEIRSAIRSSLGLEGSEGSGKDKDVKSSVEVEEL